MKPTRNPLACVFTFRFWQAICLALALLPAVAFAEVSREDAQKAWGYLVENLGGTLRPDRFENIPDEFHADLLSISEKVKAEFTNEPTKEEVEAFWKARGKKDLKLEDVEDSVKRTIKREKFAKSHPKLSERVQQANMTALFQLMVKRGDVDGKKPCIVCVPLPCPSEEVYNKAATFMDQAALVAQDKNLQLVIVRGPYGFQEQIKDSESGNWWWEELSSFPKRYEAGIKAGAVKLVDSLPGGTSTPRGFLFRDGKFVVEGNLAGWSTDPLILQDFAK